MDISRLDIEPLNITLPQIRQELKKHNPEVLDGSFLQLCRMMEEKIKRINRKNVTHFNMRFLHSLVEKGGPFHQKGNTSFHLIMVKKGLEIILNTQERTAVPSG